MLLPTLLLALAAAASAHICIIDPPQREGFNITNPGDDSCFRHSFPCGGAKKSPGPYPVYPLYSFYDWMAVTVQQNLNHYEVGYPGYIELDWTNVTDPKTEDDFFPLDFETDINFHQQSHQWNLTIYANPPNISCVGCTLRIRYTPHKPGEDPFVQCADVTFQKYQKSNSTRPRSLSARRHAPHRPPPSGAVLLTGVSNFDSALSEIVSVDVKTGDASFNYTLPFGVRRRRSAPSLGADPSDNHPYVLDQIFAYSSGSKTLLYIGHESGNWNTVPSDLVIISPAGQRILTLQGLPAPINAIICNPTTGDVYVLMIVGNNSVNFNLTLGRVLNTGQVIVLGASAPQDTFINFQWIDADWNSPSPKIYVLMGDENSLYQLDTTLFTFTIAPSSASVSSVKPDVSQYTLSGFNVINGVLYATSPGLYNPNNNSAWHLVSVDPSSGAVTHLAQIAPEGTFLPHFSQMIYGTAHYSNPGNRDVLFARFDLVDLSGISVIASISIGNEYAVSFSSPSWWAPSLSCLAYLG